ncbi:MAG: hypothetical protein PVJ67_05610 [Candidatus Pacearchaeota archaeon]|jgi:hypothetical protein
MRITIIGSMKFYEKFEELKKELEEQGNQIIGIPLPDEVYPNETNIKLKAMEDFNDDLEKSDAILVANYDKDEKTCHIGINSIMEIGMAFNRNKKIFLLNKIPEKCKDELEAINVIELNGDLAKLK